MLVVPQRYCNMCFVASRCGTCGCVMKQQTTPIAYVMFDFVLVRYNNFPTVCSTNGESMFVYNLIFSTIGVELGL